MLRQLEQFSEQIGVPLSEDMAASLRKFWRFVLETNEHTNLTRITDDREAVLKHFVDSFTVLQTGVFPPRARVVDVGTGAGFPGVPLKIVRPDIRLTLLDATLKRVRFLRHAVDKLGWDDVETVHARAEEAGREARFRGRFDVATARAVARLDRLAPLCLPFVKVGGHVVAMKGPDVDKELREAEAALAESDGRLVDAVSLQLPEGAGARTLVVVEKTAPSRRARGGRGRR